MGHVKGCFNKKMCVSSNEAERATVRVVKCLH